MWKYKKTLFFIFVILAMAFFLFMSRYFIVYMSIKDSVLQERIRENNEKYDKIIKQYEANLRNLTNDYNVLVSSYNQAVEKTIITDLEVNTVFDEVKVIVRDSRKIIKVVDCKVDLEYPIYVDYIVYENRIILRRLFDESTAPKDAKDIFEDIPEIKWDDSKLSFGRAIYRKFIHSGLYHITVSGNGALELMEASDDHFNIEYLPEAGLHNFDPIIDGIKSYNQIDSSINTNYNIHFYDVLRQLF